MKTPALLKIHLKPEHSFSVRHDVLPYFYNKWHHHPEIELIYILKGIGRQFIGNHVHHFKAGDMILLGPHLPHLWKSDDCYMEKGSTLKMESIVVHFLPECLGADFFKLPENSLLADLLFVKANRAVRIKDETKEEVALLLEQLLKSNGTKRIWLLLNILDIIANSTQTKPVSEKDIAFDFSPDETNRINTIYQYILKNFHHEIPLEKIAKVAHMTPTAFCRYFKSRLKKTFSLFLIEVRIGHAAKLLAETSKSVAEICFESGYNNFSNFNRHFKAIIGKTPMQHRKYYQEVKLSRYHAEAFHERGEES
ncbi:AraC family transcriptional regulator [Parasediminibacterium sp. JCM 36343]|uniref:AraC family transcriptional regulator n=1 Tax=Parasediminibacterium sp. JCM 36343 TaxID=3374279 RepID=UPI00397C0ECD